MKRRHLFQVKMHSLRPTHANLFTISPAEFKLRVQLAIKAHLARNAGRAVSVQVKPDVVPEKAPSTREDEETKSKRPDSDEKSKIFSIEPKRIFFC